MTQTQDRVGTIKKYFERVDAARQDVLELFHDEIDFYFPKFGIGKGKDDLVALWAGLGGTIERIAHDAGTFSYLTSGDTIVVEGTTEGRYQSGGEWSGGTTPGGRFCNVFEFEDSLICRLRVYLDPDYASDDDDRFLWGRENRAW